MELVGFEVPDGEVKPEQVTEECGKGNDDQVNEDNDPPGQDSEVSNKPVNLESQNVLLFFSRIVQSLHAQEPPDTEENLDARDGNIRIRRRSWLGRGSQYQQAKDYR